MDQAPTLVNGFQWVFEYAGMILTQWVPGLIISVASPNTPQGVTFPPAPIAGPAMPQDVANYLQAAAAPGTYDVLTRDWGIFVALSIFLCLLLLSLVVYCVIRIIEIRHFEHERWRATSHPVVAHDVPKAQLRWQRIKDEAHSDVDQSRRLAILEADIMLNELLDTLGYRGETMADKMRQVQKGDFKTIDLAWEAHRARNTIAHEGSATALSPHEVRRIISLYEQVFREFGFVQ